MICDRCSLDMDCPCLLYEIADRVRAIEKVIDVMLDDMGTVSVALLQRKFKMTYKEAVRVVDRLKEDMQEQYVD